MGLGIFVVWVPGLRTALKNYLSVYSIITFLSNEVQECRISKISKEE